MQYIDHIIRILPSYRNDYGKLGFLRNAKSLFGLLLVTVVGQLIAYKKEDYHTQHTALSAIKRMRQPNTSSLLVCSRSNFGSASCSPWTCLLWCPLDVQSPLLSGEKSLVRRCRSCTERVLTLWSYLERGSSGSIETPVCSTVWHQVFKLLYIPSKMNLIPGYLGVLRALLPWALGE